jgi:hypothetical protein
MAGAARNFPHRRMSTPDGDATWRKKKPPKVISTTVFYAPQKTSITHDKAMHNLPLCLRLP